MTCYRNVHDSFKGCPCVKTLHYEINIQFNYMPKMFTDMAVTGVHSGPFISCHVLYYQNVLSRHSVFTSCIQSLFGLCLVGALASNNSNQHKNYMFHHFPGTEKGENYMSHQRINGVSFIIGTLGFLQQSSNTVSSSCHPHRSVISSM